MTGLDPFFNLQKINIYSASVNDGELEMSFSSIGKLVSWYKNEVNFSFELMKSFVDGAEKQVDMAVDRYKKSKKIFVEESPDGIYSREVEVYQGLDSESANLDEIFSRYFPSLQRASAFLTLYSFFENELHQLCMRCKNEKKLELSPSDLKDRGIVRSVNYLGKAIRMNTYKNSKEWEYIKQLQVIRNLLAHQFGRMTDLSSELKQAVMGHQVIGVEWDQSENEVIFKKEFLSATLKKFEEYFKLLDRSIQESFSDNGKQKENGANYDI